MPKHKITDDVWMSYNKTRAPVWMARFVGTKVNINEILTTSNITTYKCAGCAFHIQEDELVSSKDQVQLEPEPGVTATGGVEYTRTQLPSTYVRKPELPKFPDFEERCFE